MKFVIVYSTRAPAVLTVRGAGGRMTVTLGSPTRIVMLCQTCGSKAALSVQTSCAPSFVSLVRSDSRDVFVSLVSWTNVSFTYRRIRPWSGTAQGTAFGSRTKFMTRSWTLVPSIPNAALFNGNTIWTVPAVDAAVAWSAASSGAANATANTEIATILFF